MYSVKFKSLVVTLCVLASFTALGAATAGERVRAYVLVEAKPGQVEAAIQSLNGLGNCLALTHSFMRDEIVAHLECDGPEHLSAALADNVTKSEAVARVTTLAVLKSQ
jgi:hypothetical protein